jgi:uncharacterized protein YjiS (DUF1127 family)
MMTRAEAAMSEAIAGFRAMERGGAMTTPAITAGWTALRSLVTGWRARQRLGRSISHLDDRLLADAGIDPRNLGFGERLIRRYGAGGGIWAGGATR